MRGSYHWYCSLLLRRQSFIKESTPTRLRMSSSSSASASAAFSSTLPCSPYLTSLFSLQGKTALITGGGTGIGAALALGLARAGATVVVAGRRVEPLQATCQRIHEQLALDQQQQQQQQTISTSGEGAAVPDDSQQSSESQQQPRQAAYYATCDLTNLDEIDALVEHATSLTGSCPTILINNAGINVRQSPQDLTAEHWNQTLTLTLTAPFVLARAMSDGMRQQNYGRIISIASLQSYQAFPNSIPYAAGKSGVLGLTRALAEAYSPEYGYDNVTANAIAPGYVATELTKSVFADVERADRLAAQTMVGRNSVPEDLVGPCIFLVSPAAAYVTGQCLPVDGGFTALGLR